MTIIKIDPLETGQHPIQSQSGRKTCWIPGYIEVPPQLEGEAWNSLGFCDLEIKDGVLTGITPGEIPPMEQAEPEPTQEEQLRADVDYIAAMTGVEL